VTAGSRDSVLGTAQVALQYPTPDGAGTATEFAIDPAKLHDVFAADLPSQQAAVMAATQRPVSELAFTEPSVHQVAEQQAVPEHGAVNASPAPRVRGAAAVAAGLRVDRSLRRGQAA
jgi:hypothetical protein